MRPLVPLLVALGTASLAPAAPCDIIGVGGNLLPIAAPSTLPSSDDHAFVWAERQNLVLPAPLAVDEVHQGDHGASGGSPSTIPAGTVLSSYIVHGDTNTSGVGPFTGRVVFDEPVVAVVWRKAGLDASDDVLGAPTVPYAPTLWRGLENMDSFRIRQHEVELSMIFQSTAYMDQVRILTAPGLAFSLDRGSDSEYRDPALDGDEVIDCGDIIHSLSGSTAGRFFDDSLYLATHRPSVAGAGTTCAGGTTIYERTLDVDAYDDVILLGISFGNGILWQSDIVNAGDRGIFRLERLLVSFDDDTSHGWSYCSPRSLPVDSSSPLGTTYGDTASEDEVLLVEFDGSLSITAGLSPVASEANVHSALAPNPDGVEAQDDDIDALDWLTAGGWQCFSVDHEGWAKITSPLPALDMDPGTVYAGDITSGTHPVVLVDRALMRLDPGTDIDAFEFAWLPYAGSGPPALALLYSVDENDDRTPEDETGGLDPCALYASFLDNSLPLHIVTFLDDIDALALMPTAPDLDATSYCTSTPTSLGAPSTISGSGSSSIAANDLVLRADNLPSAPGIFLCAADPAFVVLGDGYLCLGGPTLRRFATVNVPVGGVIVEGVDYATSVAGGIPVMAGQPFYFQRWNRDFVPGGTGTNLSDGLRVDFTP